MRRIRISSKAVEQAEAALANNCRVLAYMNVVEGLNVEAQVQLLTYFAPLVQAKSFYNSFSTMGLRATNAIGTRVDER